MDQQELQPADGLTCPFCGRPGLQDETARARHIFQNCTTRKVRREWQTRSGEIFVQCFCLAPLCVTPRDFRAPHYWGNVIDHWNRNGGLDAHLMYHLFGDEP